MIHTMFSLMMVIATAVLSRHILNHVMLHPEKGIPKNLVESKQIWMSAIESLRNVREVDDSFPEKYGIKTAMGPLISFSMTEIAIEKFL